MRHDYLCCYIGPRLSFSVYGVCRVKLPGVGSCSRLKTTSTKQSHSEHFLVHMVHLIIAT